MVVSQLMSSSSLPYCFGILSELVKIYWDRSIFTLKVSTDMMIVSFSSSGVFLLVASFPVGLVKLTLMSVLWEIQVDQDLEVYGEIYNNRVSRVSFRLAREDLTIELEILALLEVSMEVCGKGKGTSMESDSLISVFMILEGAEQKGHQGYSLFPFLLDHFPFAGSPCTAVHPLDSSLIYPPGTSVYPLVLKSTREEVLFSIPNSSSKRRVWNREAFGEVKCPVCRGGGGKKGCKGGLKKMGPFRRNFLEVEIWGVWLKEGDRNVRFLHKMVDTYKRRNLLAKIKINGLGLQKENEIKEGVGVLKIWRDFKLLTLVRGLYKWLARLLANRALKQKPYLARWVIVCLDKRIGGLGIKCLFTINKALLDKWCRRFSNEKGAFWNQVISRKCGEEREWCSREVREGFGVGLWKAIRKACQTQTFFLVGGVGGGCLELLNGRGSWNPRFTRTFSDWEVDEVEIFLLCMHGKRMLRDEEDMVL
ncbi:hypothetical protein CK203_105484 [Vitis vinifera]|uniref:Uncharacterized protein n=1 Tax=Vitis vinifera TaxID=29760 RepID=A0A438EHH3_VITVI|nr:hypothetical protein CK203_105484 [Vitis vinifera]